MPPVQSKLVLLPTEVRSIVFNYLLQPWKTEMLAPSIPKNINIQPFDVLNLAHTNPVFAADAVYALQMLVHERKAKHIIQKAARDTLEDEMWRKANFGQNEAGKHVFYSPNSVQRGQFLEQSNLVDFLKGQVLRYEAVLAAVEEIAKDWELWTTF